MPRGDFVTRNSFYEALCAGSIPVVMDEDYFMHCAFSSVIDYSDFVRTIPEADFMDDEAKNVLELLSGMHDRTAAVKSLHSLWEVRSRDAFAFPACAAFKIWSPVSLHILLDSLWDCTPCTCSIAYTTFVTDDCKTYARTSLLCKTLRG